MSKIALEPAELSYLLQTVNARSLLGVDDEALFPGSEEANQALLEEGLEKLQAHGWLSRHPTSGKMQFDNQLCYLVAVLADPEVAILTTRQEEEGVYQIVSYYLVGRVVVEQLRGGDGRFYLGVAPDQVAAVERIQQLVQVANGYEDNVNTQILLSKGAYRQVKTAVQEDKEGRAVAILVAEGADEQLARSLAQAMAHPSLRGTVVIMHRRGGEVIDTRSLSVAHHPAGRWLLRRDSQEEPLLIFEKLQPLLFNYYLTRYLENKPVNGYH